MSTATRDYQIVFSGLRDGSSRARHEFAATLARVPGWTEEHANALLARAPVVVHRTTDREEARRACAFLTEAGAQARIDESAEPAAATEAADATLASTADESDDATPARAIDIGGDPTPARPMEAHASVPAQHRAPAAAPSAAAAPASMSSMGTVPFAQRTPPPAPRRAAPVRATSLYPARAVEETPAGWAPGPEARMAATAIIGAGLLSDVIQGIHAGGISAPFAFGMLIAAALAYGIFTGSLAARVIMTGLGGLAIVVLLVVKGLLAGASPEKLPPGMAPMLGSLNGLITATVFGVALLIALLWGHGSKTKALVLGIPALALQAWVLFASLSLVPAGSATAASASADSATAASAQPPEGKELERAAALAATDTRAAILAAEPIEQKARKDGNRELLAASLVVLGSAHVAAGREDMGLDKLREALALQPGDRDIQGLIEKIEQARRAQAEADTKALQAQARGASAPKYPR